MAAKPIEQVNGRARVIADPPIVDALDRQRGQLQVPLAADLAAGHEFRPLQDAQVLQDGGAVEFR